MRAGLLLILTLGAVLCMTAQPGSARVVAGNHIAEMEQRGECILHVSLSCFVSLHMSLILFCWFHLPFRVCPTWFELLGGLAVLWWPWVRVPRKSFWPMSSCMVIKWDLSTAARTCQLPTQHNNRYLSCIGQAFVEYRNYLCNWFSEGSIDFLLLT